MFTKQEWLVIARNILRKLGYRNIIIGIDIDAEITSLPKEDKATFAYKDSLREILHDRDFTGNEGIDNY